MPALVFDVKTGKHGIAKVLRILATKGTLETLLYISKNESIGYNSILRHVVSNRIVTSRASVNSTITKLTDLGLLKRTIIQDRPIRTGYAISQKGDVVIKHLDGIEQATK